jgi:glycosyltransferase involved in cell wall biosynthesis
MVNLNSMKDFIFFATADWDTPYLTNKQHMAKEFARLGHRILYIESVGIRRPKIISGIDLKRIFFRFFRGIRGPKKVDANTNVWVLAPLVFPFGHGNKWIKLFNQSVMKWQMNCFLKQYAFSSPFIWTYHPYILDAIKNLGIRNKLIYHCVDDLSAVPGIDNISYNSEEKRLLKKADVVFVTSKHLMKKCLQYNKDTYCFANVVDFEHFSPNKKNVSIPRDLNEISEPRIVIAGALSEFKIDFKLLNQIISDNAQYSFVFIGSEIEGQNNKILKKISLLRNAYFLGYKKYNELPHYLKNMQIAFMPIKKNSYTRAMSPMKLNEYIASGLPIISTDLHFLEEYKLAKEIASIKDYSKFSKICNNLLKQGKISSFNAKRIIGENTWQERANKMLKIIDIKVES